MKPLLFSASGNDSMLAIGTYRIAPMELGWMNSAEPAGAEDTGALLGGGSSG